MPTMCEKLSMDQLMMAWIDFHRQPLIFKFLCLILKAVLCNLDQEMNFPCLLITAHLVCHLDEEAMDLAPDEE